MLGKKVRGNDEAVLKRVVEHNIFLEYYSEQWSFRKKRYFF